MLEQATFTMLMLGFGYAAIINNNEHAKTVKELEDQIAQKDREIEEERKLRERETNYALALREKVKKLTEQLKTMKEERPQE
jgi:predicted Holliday junction resolvase-like endonuclease